jgi:hypothetical protein
MTDNSSRGLLIAILIVVGLNLAATLVQTGLLLRSASAIPATAAGIDKTLPAKYTDAELAKIADRVVVPYNKQDMEAVYAAFDEIAKNEIPRDKFDAQLGHPTGTMTITVVDRESGAGIVGFFINGKTQQ